MKGFELFSPEHLLMLVFIVLVLTAVLCLSRRLTEAAAVRLICCLSITALISEVIQDILLIRDGGNFIDFLPLHLCNLGLFVNLAASFTGRKLRSFFAEISIVLIMPGAAGALIFPDWTYRPFWSYLPMLCFLTHGLLVIIPCIFIAKKTATVSIKHIWYPYLFLLIVTPPIYLLNIKCSENYMYLLYPPSGSPLDWIHSITGNDLYIPGLLMLVTIILVFEYLMIEAIRQIKKDH